jgi:hypothetical protein
VPAVPLRPAAAPARRPTWHWQGAVRLVVPRVPCVLGGFGARPVALAPDGGRASRELI